MSAPYIHILSQVCIAAVLRGENLRLREWLQHYVAEGVTHFYLINTDDLISADYTDFKAFIAPYIEAGWVTASHYSIPDFNGTGAAYLSRINLQTHALTTIALRAAQVKFSKKIQITVFCTSFVTSKNDFPEFNLMVPYLCQREGRHEWILTVDFDEFMYGVQNATLASVLESQDPRVTQLCVPWITFTSSRFLWQPHCIVPFFTERFVTPEKNRDTSGKCAARLQEVQQLQVHLHQEWNNKKPEDVVAFINGSGSAWDKHFIVTSKARSELVLQRELLGFENALLSFWDLGLSCYSCAETW